MRTEERFTDEALAKIRHELRQAQGREVLFIGHLGEDQRIARVEVGARGTAEEVPALYPHMERGDVVIHNHPSGLLEPSRPDLSVANTLGQQGIGFWIIDNEAEKVYAVSEPVLLHEIQTLPYEEAVSALLPGGAFSRLLPSYEAREQQLELLKLFVRGLNEDGVVVAQAGTGVGKSFAYLLPAVLWAQRNAEKLVIATATINLQQQLFEKDLPFVQKALGTKLKTVLVKGRRNYVCPHRLAEELRDPADLQSVGELTRLADWAAQSRTGAFQELTSPPSEELWSRICSDVDACSGVRCAQAESCFLAKARKEASAASILIANHHLLFADLALRVEGLGFETAAVMPPFQRLIFDEAHSLEKSATSYFSGEFARPLLQKQLNRLYRKRRGTELGLIPPLRGLFTQNLNLGEIPGLISALTTQLEATDRMLAEALVSESSLRLTKEQSAWWQESMVPTIHSVQKPFSKLLHLCDDLAEAWEDQEERPPEVQELKTTLRRLEGLAQMLDRFKNWDGLAEDIFWFQKGRDALGQTFVTWTVSPLSVRQVFQDAVFKPFSTVMFTSATLAVQGKFTYWGGRLGLDLVPPQRRLLGVFPSPYDYSSRVVVGIPADFPPPDSEAFTPAVAEYLISLLTACGGSALVLFTSYDALNKAYTAVRPALVEAGIPVYRQGDEDRSRLLERFKREVSSVLMATDSFWEGIDSPGETLSLVVMVRLPFRVPSEPVLAARLEALKRSGADAFMSYSLPEAVMKFQQGFGRLIRHSADYGAIVVLDNRLVNKAYGQAFLASVPETPRWVLPRRDLTPRIAKFLEQWRTRERPLPKGAKIEYGSTTQEEEGYGYSG